GLLVPAAAAARRDRKSTPRPALIPSSHENPTPCRCRNGATPNSIVAGVRQRAYSRDIAGQSGCGFPPSYTRDAAVGNVFTSSGFRGYGAAAGVTRFLNCACAGTVDACRTTATLCQPTSVELPQTSKWHDSTLLEAGAVSTLAGSLVRTNHPAYWRWAAIPEVRELTWKYWTDLGLGALTTGATTPRFSGLMWSWVKNWDENGGTPATTTTREAATASLRQSFTRLDVVEDAPTIAEPRACKFWTPRYWTWKWERFTPFGAGTAFLSVDTSDVTLNAARIRAQGFPERAAAAYLDTNVAKAIRENTNYTVLGANDLQVWSTGNVAAMVMDAKSHKYVGSFVQDNTGTVPRVTMATTPAPVGTPRAYAMVAAMSGRRQEAAIFSDKDGAGQTIQAMRTFNLVSGNGSRPYVGGEVLYAPAAATYRAEDDSYYVLDKNPGPRAVLLRIGRTLWVEKVAEWPRGTVYTNYGLTTGADGSIVITTSGTTDPKHCVAVLRPDPTVTGNPANPPLVPYKRFMSVGTNMDLPADLGIDGSLGMVTITTDGSREFLGRALASGTNINLSDVGACF
ncbi:MAG: hypothetical protein HOO96_24745, partial [Polyangiaceae bacterium]|nr:hypothetical protein [Polyangiaceae bacterium]